MSVVGVLTLLITLILPELIAVFSLTKVKGTADPQLPRSEKNTTHIFIQSSGRSPCQGTPLHMSKGSLYYYFQLLRTMSIDVGYPSMYQ